MTLVMNDRVSEIGMNDMFGFLKMPTILRETRTMFCSSVPIIVYLIIVFEFSPRPIANAAILIPERRGGRFDVSSFLSSSDP